MGQKAKYRKAMNQAIAQYGAELSKLTPITDSGTIKANAYRTATESVGDSLSGADRRALRKTDSLARKINNDDAYKAGIAKYNDRLGILQEQMAGRGVDRFYLSDSPGGSGAAPNRPQNQSTSFNTIAGPVTQTGSSPSMASVNQIAPPPDISYKLDRTYASSRDELLSEAQKKADAYNASMAGSTSGGLLGAKFTPVTADAFIGTQRFEAAPTVVGGDRSARFSRLDAGAKDMQAIADSIRSTAGEAAATQYATLAEKLNGRLTRAADVAVINPQQADQATGLLSNELNNGVIR